MTSVERMNIPFPMAKYPDFDIENQKYRDALVKSVKSTKGENWDLVSYDVGEQLATFERPATVNQVRFTENSMELDLVPALAKPAKGDEVAATYEDALKNKGKPGYYMTDFNPHLRKATFTQLTTGAHRTRKALATALSVKPWDVKIATQPDGGYQITLPETYIPSKHETKVEEITVEIAGQVGWRTEINATTLECRMIPGEPPLFPAALSYPMEELGPDGNIDVTPIGFGLPQEGTGVGPRVEIDWTDSAFALLGGLPGSGKTVTINAIVAHQRACGAQLVIVDDASKAVDFEWAKPYVRPGGWGCDSFRQSVAALAMAYEEGQQRSKILSAEGVTNWLDLQDRFEPIFVVVDELSALVGLEPVPKGLPKDHELVMEANEINYYKQLIFRYINKIIAEQRFVGVRMLDSTQITNASSGLPPTTRSKIGHKFLQGNNPSKSQREQMFNDANGVVTVPPHVQASGKQARGVGVADMEGKASVVYKSLFATTKDYLARFQELGLSTTDRPEPTTEQMNKYAPHLDMDDEGGDRADTPSGKPLDPRFGPVETFDENGDRLFGAAAAAAASKQETVKAGPPCPECGKPINAGCRC